MQQQKHNKWAMSGLLLLLLLRSQLAARWLQVPGGHSGKVE